MWQAQKTDFERGKRRKEELSAGSCLGHTVKNCMTVIKIDGALSGNLELKLTLRGQLSFSANKQSHEHYEQATCLHVSMSHGARDEQRERRRRSLLSLLMSDLIRKAGCNMAIFTGAGVAIVTPFHEDGKINYEKFAELVEDQIAGGTDAIIVCGTTGESSTLTHEEHLDLIKFCAEQVKGRIPVVAGTGSNCTDTAVYLSEEAEKYGVDGLLLVTPYYNKATQSGLFKHYKRVADAVKLPIILYNVPSRTGCNILPQTAVKLCTEVSNIVGIKEASGNISQIAKLMSLADGKVDLYSGNDDHVVPLLALGGIGVISVVSNVAPRQMHDICQKFFDGDLEGSAKEQLRAIELCDALFCEVNPIPVKTAMNLMGKNVGPTRMPLSEMEPKNVEILKTALKNYGLLA